MPEIVVRGAVGDREIVFRAGKLAMQADGAVTVSLGDTQVLVTATANKTLREGTDFFPLTVDVEERMYAAGKIPGSFFRREGRATEKAILTARLIDRPLRPAFADGFRSETQVVATILSVDNENAYDVIALNGASAALMVSTIPFQGPIGAVRLALRNGEWTAMPTYEELEESVFELVVAGRRNDTGEIDILMVEAGSTEDGLRLIAGGQPPSDEESVGRGLEEAKVYIAQSIDLQLELRRLVEVEEGDWPVVVDYPSELLDRVAELSRVPLTDVVTTSTKADRKSAEEAAWAAIELELRIDDPVELAAARKAFGSTLKRMMRERVINEGIRLDGRGPADLRPLSAEVGVVSRTHGSGLFQRGDTQVLNLATLGMLKMEQMLDTLSIEESKRYMHHYNFPPFSTGEAGFMRGPRRREIGHGALAEKALLPVIPDEEEFPYALRLVSEVLSSNGSTSMASVCASTLSLMDAGVPISDPVGGVAMGLIAQDGQFVTLTDIIGAEDALGDMDFKVAGTADVITALQLDTKIQGLPSQVLADALAQAREARLRILEVMREAIPSPRTDLNQWAPRIEAIKIPKDKIGEVIGPKGKVIRELEEQTGATIEIEEEGSHGIVRIGSNNAESLNAARERINLIVNPPEVEVGADYDGEVVNITSFGAFVNILPGRDGLLHISKLDAERRVNRVEDYLNLGDAIKVTVREVDRNGKVSLDLAEPIELTEEQKANLAAAPRNGGRDRDRDRDRGGRGGSDRGGRDRDRRGSDRDRGGDRRSSYDRQPPAQPAPSTQGSGERRRAAVSLEDVMEEMDGE
ncbi:MAG TPA: polyribonucleotide nucleotidyltransferase [Acidimicrobiia bacterium]|nr:polyribonucleotide nucleotidyltransferase [Acidimicrobiia bacterium]